ncbi:hypothetical protein MTR_1g050170 [Medicago truncatula]|uniref:Secreted protein n=1 Tax=Medicago truncatula TaxID=3880 RepID=G7I7A4_MEDTR|nr:hypothetical protein MTR_1g050170 [Medicago truncatula]
MEFWKLLCSSVLITFSSAVNSRGFPRQLTAAGFLKLRQLTAERHLSNLLLWHSQTKCGNSNSQVRFVVVVRG